MELLLPNRTEQRWGWRFLLFQLTFLGLFLALALRLFGLSVNNADFNLLYYLCSLAAVIVIFRRFLVDTLRQCPRKITNILIAVLAGFVAIRLLSIAVSLLVYYLNPQFQNANDQAVAENTRQSLLSTGIVTVLLAPVVEETLYRGAVFGSLYRRNKVWAYLVSMVLFAFVHISGYIGAVPPMTLALAFLQYLPAGLCLAGAYQYTGSLLAPIFIHAAINAVAIFAMR